MAKRYSVEELKGIGMGEEQINAIINTYKRESVSGQNNNASNIEDGAEKYKNNAAENMSASDHDTAPVNCSAPLGVTSIFDLQEYSKGTLVRFPDFAEGQPFIARVRRPSMLVMAKQGKIPNTLLESANELFSKGGAGLDVDNSNMLSDIYDIIEIICESALKEPTYQQIKDAGLELSDNQLMAIFNYTQTGAKALEPFH